MGEHSLPRKWLEISTAPSGTDLEVCVIDQQGEHALVVPCRKNGSEWVDAATAKPIDIRPTHWRLWDEDRQITS